MMEESGLAVVILIVTVSDEKCISFSSVLIYQLCNTLTGPMSLEHVIKNKKEKKYVWTYERRSEWEEREEEKRHEKERDKDR